MSVALPNGVLPSACPTVFAGYDPAEVDDMTQLMERAVERLRALPDEEQDRRAEQLIRDLEEDAKWEATTAKYEGKLETLVEEVLAEGRAGKLEQLDPDRL